MNLFGNVSATAIADTDVSTAHIEEVIKIDTTAFQEKNTEDIVREYFKDIPVMIDIAFCESRFRQHNKEGEIFRGAVNPDDVGVMQVNTFYHLKTAESLGMDLFSLEGNLAYAKRLFEKEGTKPWKSSSKCWIPRSNLIAKK